MSGRTDPMNATGEDIRDVFKAMYKRQAHMDPSTSPQRAYGPLARIGCWGSPLRMPPQPWWKQGLNGIAGIVRMAVEWWISSPDHDGAVAYRTSRRGVARLLAWISGLACERARIHPAIPMDRSPLPVMMSALHRPMVSLGG